MGELKYIEKFYESIKYLIKDPEHFVKLDLSSSVMNFTYFDNVRVHCRGGENNISSAAGVDRLREYLELPKTYGV